ncbi:MAG TPA: hypothetical protein VKA32_05870 [Gammaproteobacteria bacterium]|nr:hypothetical protein [Gammaproteobacteria bacterium]
MLFSTYRRTRSGAAAICLGLVLALPALADGPQIQVKHSEKIGDYLTDSEGNTLYLFGKDEQGMSTCHDACARAWPPLLTDGAASAGAGVDADRLSTTKRKDGTTQVTYGGWPLYRFVKDGAPGDIHGQEVNGFGGEWYAVSPAGGKAEAGETGDQSDGSSGGSGESW